MTNIYDYYFEFCHSQPNCSNNYQYSDLSERRDEGSQTDLTKTPFGGVTELERKNIEKEAYLKAEKEFIAKLDAKALAHQTEIAKTKKKQWCTVCLKEGQY